MDDFSGQEQQTSNSVFPPKPLLAQKSQNALVRSLISLFIYGLLFYFVFGQNLAYIAAILVVLIIHESGHFLFMKFRASNADLIERIFLLLQNLYERLRDFS